MYPRRGRPNYGKVISEQAISLNHHEIIVISPVPYTPFILSLFSKKYREYRKIPKEDVVKSIKVYYPRYIAPPGAKLFCLSGRLMYLGIKGLVKRLNKKHRFHLIHSHFAMPDGWAAARLAKKNGSKYINTIQATDLDITIKSCKKELQYALTNANRIISPTPALKAKLKAHLNLDAVVIGYGYNQVYHEFVAYNFSRKTLRIISISRLIKTKGIEDNLRAVKKLKDQGINLEYKIIGDGEEMENLKALAKELDIEDATIFLGWLNHHDAVEELTLSDIFILPSYRETFGLVYLEALAAGTIVIGAKGHGFDGIIKNQINGFLVRPMEPKDIANVIIYIIKNPLKAKRIAIRGKLTSKEFTFEKIAKKIDNLYYDAIKG